MFFKKKMAAADFATGLAASHSQLFGPENLSDLLARSGAKVPDGRQAAAMWEWFILGLYSFRNVVSGNCSDDLKLRDAILDAFFRAVYSGLEKAGFDTVAFIEFERHIRDRFGEYDDAWANQSAAGPAWHFAVAVGRNVTAQRTPPSGEWWRDDDSMSLFCFGTEATAYVNSIGLRIKKLFSEYKIRAEG